MLVGQRFDQPLRKIAELIEPAHQADKFGDQGHGFVELLLGFFLLIALQDFKLHGFELCDLCFNLIQIHGRVSYD
ncbi:hypothetical protein ASG58_21340 [Rhizobium sp. Leaf383]|nr:hypothetical protein ASG58_21340 [Rhizobium sp. Leaf383]